MLSGIGPQEQLERWQNKPVKILEGVGQNLQARYEVGVVHELNEPWQSLKDAEFKTDDGPYREWDKKRSGIYTTNGAILAVILRSFAQRQLPDLFCFALVGTFHGYYPGYSRLFSEPIGHLTRAHLTAPTLTCRC